MDELEKDSWYYFTLPSEGDTWYPVWISDNNECVLDGKRIKLTKLEGMIFEKAVMPKAPTCTANERKFLDEIREKGEWASSHGAIWLDNGSEIFQSDLETDLRKLIKGE